MLSNLQAAETVTSKLQRFLARKGRSVNVEVERVILVDLELVGQVVGLQQGEVVQSM